MAEGGSSPPGASMTERPNRSISTEVNLSESEDSDTRTSSASSSSGFEFKFDTSNWSPENVTGLNLLGLQPQGFGADFMEVTPQQANTVGKIKRPKSRLYCRRGAVVLQKNPLGRDVQGERKLRQAAMRGNYDEVQQLLDSGVNPTRADEKGRTALHFATTRGNRPIVKLLLDNGADVNQKDKIGNTPLHLAAIGSHIGVVTALLESGANAHEMDRGGHTPLKLAHSRLKHLRKDGQLTSLQLKSEVIQLISMLRVYMTNLGKGEQMQELDQINARLQRNSTVMDDGTVDQLQDVLDGFTNMTIYHGI